MIKLYDNLTRLSPPRGAFGNPPLCPDGGKKGEGKNQ